MGIPAYKDTVPGLDALRKNYMICPLSNGSGKKILESVCQFYGASPAVCFIVPSSEQNKRNGMNFDLVLPSTVTRNYKPNPKVYQAAIDAFELEEHQTLAFVAAHAWDLAAAGEQ